MKVLACLLVMGLAVYALPLLEDVEKEWSKFKQTYGKSYKSAIQENLRKAIFVENYQLILEHNELYAKGQVSHFLKINQFADMGRKERNALLNGYKTSESGKVDAEQFEPDKNKDLPESFDWRTKGAVTGVKDQNGCGSCWSFSAIGALETQYFLKTGKLVSLSEQNLVDCVDSEVGCDGGNINQAFEYVYRNDGVDSEETYPYEAYDGKCRYQVSGNVTSLKGFSSIESGNEDHLKAAVATAGSISVAIDASQDDFRFYGGGIYYNSKCTSRLGTLSHAVLAVGYDNEDGQAYWQVKNSWGTDWGETGYIKMSRNKDNNCGITTEASFPLMY